MAKLIFFLRIAAFALLIFIWDYIFINYRQLPGKIPIHFDLSGTPDSYARKALIWMLAAVATAIYVALYFMSRTPKSPLFNLPENLKNEVQQSQLTVSALNFLVMAIFSVLAYETVAVALGREQGLSAVLNYLLGAIVLFVILVALISRKKKGDDTISKTTS